MGVVSRWRVSTDRTVDPIERDVNGTLELPTDLSYVVDVSPPTVVRGLAQTWYDEDLNSQTTTRLEDAQPVSPRMFSSGSASGGGQPQLPRAGQFLGLKFLSVSVP